MIFSMKEIRRYAPEKAFPSYIFIPGENPHPKKAGGHMEGEADPVSSVIDLNHPEQSKALRFALDLFNHGYYWESHVWFESLWNAHGRVGCVADFLKGLIKLGAAGVKISIGEKENAKDHFIRAKELFSIVQSSEGDKFLGFHLKELISQCDHFEMFEVHPSWS